MRWRHPVLIGALLLPVPGCTVEVTSGGSGGLPGSDQLASTLETMFAVEAGGATASIRCPSGLTGNSGHRLRCEGETSDGFTLEIAVLERGEGGFRWDVVESHPIR